MGRSGLAHEGTIIEPVADRSDEYLLFTDRYSYDWFRGGLTDKDYLTRRLRKFLEALRPDVVHLQHTLFLGYDVLREIRNTLPDAAIVYTLHEYAPICFRDGQMVRTYDDGLCEASSPRACHECFPDYSTRDFYLRKRFIQSHFEVVDRFISPSRFLRDRYVAWGLPADRIEYEENGRVAPTRVAAPTVRRTRDRFGFFGQMTRYKGLDVLLEAMTHLAGEDGTGTPALEGDAAEIANVLAAVLGTPPPVGARAAGQLFVHGANLDMQHGEYRDRIDTLMQQNAGRVTMMGRYRPEDLGNLMENVDWVVVPSIWWENSPLVIQEAFAHGRPVICSDIGGMAEKVTDGHDGLHFRARDPRSLARVLRRATTEDGLWARLRAGIPPVHAMADHVGRLTTLYDDLLAVRAGGTSRDRPSEEAAS
jgi:glycosyltransferase involved in cell wall biosynthesis